MKYTQYFLFVRQRPDRPAIKEEWILETIRNPSKTAGQSDGRIRKWSYIEEVGKYLRLIFDELVKSNQRRHADESRHPEHIEIPGFRIKSGMTKEEFSDFLRERHICKWKKSLYKPLQPAVLSVG
jgi:hypothetical protein